MFRRPLPKRATIAAALGALYAFLILPSPHAFLGVNFLGVAWFLLSLSLLFLLPLAYHAYSTWALVFVVMRGVGYYRDAAPWYYPLFDLALPVASVLLLMSSSYLRDAKLWKEKEKAAEAADAGDAG